MAAHVGRPSATLDMVIPALRLAFSAAPVSPLDSPLIARLRKGIVAGTQVVRAVTEPLPVLQLAQWLRRLPDNAQLSGQQLRVKCAALAAVVLIARPSDLTHIAIDGLRFADDLSTMSLSCLGSRMIITAMALFFRCRRVPNRRCASFAPARASQGIQRRWPRASHLFSVSVMASL